MIIHDIADYLVNLTCKDIKPDIYSVFDSPCENNCPNNVNSEKLTILEILNAIGCRLKNLFGFVKINTTTKTVDTGEASVNVTGDVDNLNFDFTIPQGERGPAGAPGPENLVIVTATASTTVQGEYIPDTTYTKALADIQANKAVMIKLENVPGRYYIPYSSSNAEILASAGTVSGSKQSIELYLLKWTASNNTITITGTKEGCIADGGTAGQVLVKKSNESFDTEWVDNAGGGSTVSVNVGETTTGEPGTNASVTNSGDETNVVLNFTIPRGNTGPAGKQGPAGEPGPAGPGVATGGTTGQILAKKSNTNGDTKWIDPPSGSTVSVNVGTTTTGEPGTNANVTNSGDETNVVLNFTIPRGDTGPAGPGVATGGTTGQVLAKKSDANYDTEWVDNAGGGSTVSVNVGETTTGEPGTNASVTNSGDETNVVLNFTIPRGNTGPAGKQGPAGEPGPAGPGVATGGTTGQILAKKSNANFDTEWIDVPNSGGLTKTILWTNPNPKNEMTGTQIVMSDFITNYKLITIEYLLSTTLQKVITIVCNKNTDFTETRLYYYDGYRDVKLFGQTLFVTNGWNLKTNVSDSTQVIPLRIVAYD